MTIPSYRPCSKKASSPKAKPRTIRASTSITRALGVEETVQCDTLDFPFPDKGTLIICTDGLTNMVEADDIYAIVQAAGAEQAVGRLVDAANEAGGNDNITVVAIG